MRRLLLVVMLVAGLPGIALAHFLMLLPDKEFVDPAQRTVRFKVIFTHPMAGGPTMSLAPPEEVGVYFRGKKISLKKALVSREVLAFPRWHEDFSPEKKARAWAFEYTFSRPGDYVFYVIPKPYFEPAEGVFIKQITKVVVNAFGAESGWDAYLGLPVEIVPLVRPYGLWAGNLFCGRVFKDGKPLPGAEVEVEYHNRKGGIKLPHPSFETQVLKTNEEGEFCYAFPWAGWWGFSVLSEGDPVVKDGKKYPLELDAVIWLKVYPRPGEP